MGDLLAAQDHAGIAQQAAETALAALREIRGLTKAADASKSTAEAIRSAVAALVDGLGINHEWDGTRLRLRLPDGTYGPEVDLQGAPGDPAPPPVLALGSVTSGSEADANVFPDPTNPRRFLIDLILPRGRPGSVGGVNMVLQAIADLTPEPDRLAYFTGEGTAALATISSFGRNLVGKTDSAAAKALLALAVSDVGGLAPRLDTIDGHVADLNTATAGLPALSASFATLDQNVDNLSGDVSAIGGNVSTLGTHVAAIDTNVGALSGSVAALDANVNTLGTHVAATDANVGALSGSVATLGGTVTALGGNVAAIDGHVTTIDMHVGALDTHVSALDADVGNRLAKSQNLGDLADKEAARANVGLGYATKALAKDGTDDASAMTPLKVAQAIKAQAVPAIDTVAALAALAGKLDGGEIIRLRGYTAVGDGGGGDLVYDSASTLPDNGGRVFAAPPIVGRFIRPADGFLHSKWFGIKHDNTSGQADKFQKFVLEIVNTDYTGYVDPGSIQVDGATIYVTQDGTRNLYKDMVAAQNEAGQTPANSNRAFGAFFTGSARETAILRNGTLCVNPPIDRNFPVQNRGGAGTVRISNLRIYGNLDATNLQINCAFDGVQVFSQVGMMPSRAYADTLPWIEGWAINVLGSNHMKLDNLASYDQGSQAGNPANRNGIRISGCVNPTLISGAANGSNTGYFFGSIYDTDGSTIVGVVSHIQIFGTHSEGCQKESVVLENVIGADIAMHVRPYGWDAANYAAMRLGSLASGNVPAATAVNVSIRDSYFTNSNLATTAHPEYEHTLAGGGAGTMIRAVNTRNFAYDRLYFGDIVNCIELTSGAQNTDPGRTDQLGNSTNALVTSSSATFVPDYDPLVCKPIVLTPGPTVQWNATLGKLTFKLQLTGNHTIAAPTNLQAGLQYVLLVTKTAAANKITSWNAIFSFAGPPPTLAGVAVGVTTRFVFVHDGTSLTATYTVLDPAANFSGATLSSQSPAVAGGIVASSAADVGCMLSVATGSTDAAYTLPATAGVPDGAYLGLFKSDAAAGRLIILAPDGATTTGWLNQQTDRVVFRFNATANAWVVHEKLILPVTEVFRTVGTATWTKNPFATDYEITGIGSGSGGGSARRGAAGSARSGGGGGTHGAVVNKRFPAAKLGAQETVTIDAGGAGGAAATSDSTDGVAGAAGGVTSFGAWVKARSGTTGGAGGGAAAAAGAAAPTGFSTLGVPIAGTSSSVTANATTPTGGLVGAGAGGGGISTANTAFSGGSGASGSSAAPTSVAGGTAGAAGTTGDGAPGGAGSPITDSETQYGGGGGGGGGASNAGAGGAGGAGAAPGGGGGGGGASLNGFASGAGGAGGRGEIRVKAYF